MGTGPVRVRVDDATNVVVVHAALNSMTVVYGAIETLARSWDRLDTEQRADLLLMVELQASHAAQLLRDSQVAPVSVHLGEDRRGEPPYFVLLRHVVTALEITRVTVLAARPEDEVLSESDEKVLAQVLSKIDGLARDLHDLMRGISAGLASALDDLRL